MNKLAKGIVGGSLATLGAAAAATLAVRTVQFTPPAEEPRTIEPVDFDFDAAVGCLQSLIRCRTVSYYDHALEDDAEFEKLVGLLPELYPHVFEACTLTRLDDRALLFKWPGREPGNPSVLMAHYDVVPVDESLWEHDPFGAEIIDGVLWGRGALDTKVTFNGAMFSVNTLIGRGFVPKHDVYLAFSGCEEISGPGAAHIVDWFIEQGLTPEMVLDEGGAVVQDIFPGLERPCGLIGIAEKGMIDVSLSVESNGGHASAPKPHSPVVALAEAIDAVESKPMQLKLSEPVRKMFDTLGRYTGMPYRTLFSTIDAFTPALDILTRKTGGNLNALLRTTIAFTQMQGSAAPNVIPPVASVVANIRINPDDSIKGVLDYLEKTIGDPDVKVEVKEGWEPSPVSRTDCEGYGRIARAVADTWTDCVVSPYVMVQCSDARHWGKLTDRAYRFCGYDVTSEELATIHGNNERIPLDVLRRNIEFYLRVVEQC